MKRTSIVLFGPKTRKTTVREKPFVKSLTIGVYSQKYILIKNNNTNSKKTQCSILNMQKLVKKKKKNGLQSIIN
jgi:hypothetical protein